MPRRPDATLPPGIDPRAVLDGPLLALDVSSTAGGWSLFAGGKPDRMGLIVPPPRLPSIERIDLIAAGIAVAVMAHRPAACVLEWSAGKVAGRLGRVHGGAVLGQAQGVVRGYLLAVDLRPWLVPENAWTRGVPKAERAALLAVTCPEYAAFAKAEPDPGFDVADSVGLGLWALGRAREAELVARAGGGMGIGAAKGGRG